MSAHRKIDHCLKYVMVVAFINCLIPNVVVLYWSRNQCDFELNVIYLSFCVILGLSSVSHESRFKGYRMCFAGRSWRSFGTGTVLFLCHDGILYKYSVSSQFVYSVFDLPAEGVHEHQNAAL